MSRKVEVSAVMVCMAMIIALGGFADVAKAQDDGIDVLVGTGTILHRSGGTLLVDVKEGPNGPGMHKFNLKDTTGLRFKNRQGQYVEVFDLKAGNSVTVYRHESRPAPVVVTYEEVEQIKMAEPAVPESLPEATPAPAPAPAPAPMLPKTGSPLPLILMLGLVVLAVGVTLTVVRKL